METEDRMNPPPYATGKRGCWVMLPGERRWWHWLLRREPALEPTWIEWGDEAPCFTLGASGNIGATFNVVDASNWV